ncbi:hypothetical protein EDD18DRAFT_1110321 [Armillaria luteobubalina]|uniref:Uncharacterized protein n=1 Tax=Armillaria luteobubalina TaxID=153913 RepID=A0AA39PPW9_9AGAR|nr:hypothetical protein EDD18DRAFT_1110321 [Armillaria luteobubalina]
MGSDEVSETIVHEQMLEADHAICERRVAGGTELSAAPGQLHANMSSTDERVPVAPQDSGWDIMSVASGHDMDGYDTSGYVLRSRHFSMTKVGAGNARSSSDTIRRNPFVDIEAVDDECQDEYSTDEQSEEFVVADDESDITQRFACFCSSDESDVHAEPAYLADIVRRWDFEVGMSTVSDVPDTEYMFHREHYAMDDYAVPDIAAGPLTCSPSIDESYIWQMKCRRHHGLYIAQNILMCAEHVPVVRELVRAVISVPHDAYCVYLEARMSQALKQWLATVPGAVLFNNSVQLSAVDYSEWHKVMTLLPKYRAPYTGDRWHSIAYGPSVGRPVFVIGESADRQQLGYDVLMVPMLSLQRGAYDSHPVQSLQPMLFDATTMVIIHGEELLREIVEDIHVHQAPKPSSWEFFLGELVAIRRRAGRGTWNMSDEIEDRVGVVVEMGLVKTVVEEWLTIEKVFELGQEVTGKGVEGLVDTVESNAVHISAMGCEGDGELMINRRIVHPNSVQLSTPSPVCKLPLAPVTVRSLVGRPFDRATIFVGRCGIVHKGRSPFRGLLVIVKNVRWEAVHVADARDLCPAANASDDETSPSLDSADVCSSCHDWRSSVYAPGGGGFSELWMPYSHVVDAVTHLPLDIAPCSPGQQLFLPPVSAASSSLHRETRSVTPLPMAEEASMSPAWNPASSSSDVRCSTAAVDAAASSSTMAGPVHWSQDMRMEAIGNLKLRVLVDGRECRGSLVRHENHMQLRLLRGGIIEPNRIQPRCPTPRNQHGSLWVIIRGQHCGLLVRGVRYYRHGIATWWVVRVTERRSGNSWVYLDTELEIESTDLTIVVEPTLDKEINRSDTYKMREFSRVDYFKKG